MEKGRPRLRAAGNVEPLTYCTVRAMLVFWVREPEVAVIVTIWTPAGVPGLLGAVGAEETGVAAAFIELEQPTTAKVEPSSSTIRPRSRNGFPLLIARRREKISIEPKGIKNAIADTNVSLPLKMRF
jgi:hypothetical protein